MSSPAPLGIAIAILACAPSWAAQPSDLLSRAIAATADPARGAQIYREHCARCHRARGAGTGDRQYPVLAGQQQRYLLEQLVGFVSLDRRAPKMHEVLEQSSIADPQSLSDVSAYLAAQPQQLHGEHGDGMRLGAGRKIYNDRCAGCHGRLGLGRAQGPIPAIGGQNYTYLLIQLKGFGAGHRTKADPEVIGAVSRLSANERRAVADYISRMPASVEASYGVVP